MFWLCWRCQGTRQCPRVRLLVAGTPSATLMSVWRKPEFLVGLESNSRAYELPPSPTKKLDAVVRCIRYIPTITTISDLYVVDSSRKCWCWRARSLDIPGFELSTNGHAKFGSLTFFPLSYWTGKSWTVRVVTHGIIGSSAITPTSHRDGWKRSANIKDRHGPTISLRNFNSAVLLILLDGILDDCRIHTGIPWRAGWTYSPTTETDSIHTVWKINQH